MTINEYRTLEQLTITDIVLLEQAYYRCIAEGYHPGWNFTDFLEIVTGREDHYIIPTVEQELLEKSQ